MLHWNTRSAILLFAVDLVREGAMLHDIGRGASHTILHAQRGADLLRAQGISEEVARIVECHTGAGLTADECTLLRVSPRDCIPQTTRKRRSLPTPITLLKGESG